MMVTKKLKLYQILSGIVFTFLAIFAIVQAALPARESTAVSNLFTSITLFGREIGEIKFFGKTFSMDEFASFLRKLVGHYGLFTMLGLFGFFTFYSGKNFKNAVIIDLSVNLSLALLTEFIEYFSPGRAFLLADIILDAMGFITSLSVTSAVISAIRFKTDRRRKGVYPLVTITFLVFAVLFLLFNQESFYTYFCYALYLLLCFPSSIVLFLTK